MPEKRPRLLAGLALSLAAGLVLVAGCGGDDDAADEGSTTTARATAPVPPGALSIEERVVDQDLGGLASAGAVQVAATAEDFARLVDDDDPGPEASALEAARFVEGAVVEYGDEERTFGLSAAIECGSPELARAEAARLGEELIEDVPPDASRGPLAGVPGSQTLVASGGEGDQAFEVAGAVFADGPFVYVQAVGGAADAVDQQGVLDAASALYGEVEGRPAP